MYVYNICLCTYIRTRDGEMHEHCYLRSASIFLAASPAICHLRARGIVLYIGGEKRMSSSRGEKLSLCGCLVVEVYTFDSVVIKPGVWLMTVIAS